MAIRGSNDDMYPCFGYAYREMKKYLEVSLLSTAYKPSDLFKFYLNARDNGHQYQKYILGEWGKEKMNLIEAIKYMKDGGKVTHEHLKNFGIVYLLSNNFHLYRMSNGACNIEIEQSLGVLNLPTDGWTKYEEIKKCPFCGGEADIRRVNCGYIDVWVADCDSCDCVIGEHFPSRKLAIDAWNKRE